MLGAARRLRQFEQQTFPSQHSSKMKLLYPERPEYFQLNPDLLQGFGVDIQAYDPKELIPDQHLDAEILVTWTNSPDNLKHAASNMKNLKWIQSCAAGPNDVLNAGFDASKITVCTGSGLHDHTVAEHSLALLLSAARRLDEMKQSQMSGKWPGHLGGPQPDRPKGKFTTLRDANVTIWGFGNIAKTLAPVLIALGANVRGVARSHGVRSGVHVFSEDKLEKVLKDTDALIMILPGSDSTKDALNAERLRMLPNHAWVVNVGRGTAIDENALADALEKGEIGGAALDVFVTEPLPEESRLWKTPNTIISPHAAGGRPQEAEELITRNLRKFLAGQKLENTI